MNDLNFLECVDIFVPNQNLVRQFSRPISYNLFSFGSPHCSIFRGIIQALVTRYTKHSAFLKFLRQGNDVVIEEPKLALLPAYRRIRVGSTRRKRCVHLRE
jgi:hypothetical protein